MPRVPNADETRNILEHHVIGNKTDTAVTAASATASIIAYLKGMIGQQSGAAGLPAFPSGVAAANDVSLAEVLRFVQENVIVGAGTALPANMSLYGVLAGATGIAAFPAAAAPANDVSMAEVLREIYELGERVISSVAVPLDAGDQDTLFTIAGGPIEIINIWVDITEAVSAHAALIHFESNPTVGASSTEIAEGTAAVDIQSAALGDVFHLNGDSQDKMKKAAVGTDLPVKENQNGGIFCPVGAIDLKLSASNPTSGIATVWMRYKPIGRGVTVV